MARNDWVTFEEATLDVMNKVHNFGSDTFSVRLITDAATEPVAGTATPRWADFSGNECTQGGGYTTGGETLSGTSTAEAAGVTTFDEVYIGTRGLDRTNPVAHTKLISFQQIDNYIIDSKISLYSFPEGWPIKTKTSPLKRKLPRGSLKIWGSHVSGLS